jgi:SAM-dependent methyltransferase
MRAAVTAAVEFGIARAGAVAVRALDRDVIGQDHHPRGTAGRVAAWEMAHRPSNRQRSAWVVALLDVRPADQVLEAGFGPGLADHSEVMLRQASRRNAAAIRDGRVTLMLAPVDQLPPALDGPFDAIFAINSLGLWPAPAQRLAELRRRLAPGGRIAIAFQPRCAGATADTTRSTAREIEDLLRSAGYAKPRVETLNLDPPVACVLAANPGPFA